MLIIVSIFVYKSFSIESHMITTTLDKMDRGDDTQRRFRYQNSCACLISLKMLEDDSTYQEIYCEHFEDILLKLKTGKYAGVQIKTRDNNLGCFDIKDEAVENSISRFIKLDIQFKGLFSYFVLATNVGFYKSDSKGLNELIKWSKTIQLSSILKSRTEFAKLVKKLSGSISDCSCEDVITTLSKIRTKGDMPQFNDIEDKIFSKLCALGTYGTIPPRIIKLAISRLIMKHFDASSLVYNGRMDFYVFAKDYEGDEIQITIRSKTINKEIITSIINEVIENPEPIIKTKNPESILSIPKTTSVLERKMDKGDINIDNVTLMKDNKFATESFMTKEYYRSNKLSEEKYNQIRQIVLNECQASYDSFNKNSIFGLEMLNDVRNRLMERYKLDKTCFFGCTPEHLLGMAGILTEECKVWWSEKFEIKK